MASELSTQITQLAADSGYALDNNELVRGVTSAYTANAGFPGQFAQANRIAHRWMFTDSVQHDQATATAGSSTSLRCSPTTRCGRRSAISTSMSPRR